MGSSRGQEGVDSVLRVLPIRRAFSTEPARVRLIPERCRAGRERVVDREVVEHDETNDDLDV